MTLELSLMGGAFAVMAFLYIQQYLASRHGIVTPVQKVAEKANPVLEELHSETKELAGHFNLHTLSLHLHGAFVYIGKLFVRVSHKISQVSSNIVERAAQRKETLIKSGPASFYLKQIKDAKENGEEGKIEE